MVLISYHQLKFDHYNGRQVLSTLYQYTLTLTQ